MKLKHLPHCLALSAGLFSGQQALAGDLLHWQDNSLSYLCLLYTSDAADE